jgi:DNA helicase-2/ATP-dependent DNA helicase PcrA
MSDAAVAPLLEQLNPEQREAVTHEDGPLLVLAGAGTGKTTTLCTRVAWLLVRGAAPERMLLLTFTRRAAREMVQRARALATRTVAGCGPIRGGTFHSVAHRVVRAHASSLGLADGFGLLDAADAVDLLDLVRQEQGQAARASRFPRASTMLDIYSCTVNAQRPLAEILAERYPWCAQHREALAQTFRAYGARKRSFGVVDLDDLLLYWRALAADEVIGTRLAGAFDHVFVDEYQDVNGLQAQIVRSLCERSRALTVVGDDFQAIYGFRAASAAHILEFPSHFPGTRTVTLVRNYRSSAPILAVANAVSAQDAKGYPKRLRSERGNGVAPELCVPRDESEQAAQVCERVLAAREQAIALREQAVLFRAGHDSALLELELARRSIPFVKYGGLRYLDAAHVKDLIALLRLAGNGGGGDELSWFRVLQLLDGVGPTRARRVLDALRPVDGAAPLAQRWAHAEAHVPEHARAHASALFAALTADQTGRSASACVEALCAVLRPLLRLRYDDAIAREQDLDQLVAAARGSRNVREFVAELVLDPPASSADLAGRPHLDEDYLVLSTVHSAKGLEWDAVHLIAAYDGNFPADMNAGSEEGIAEERRLMYVALTRARRRLHVYVPMRYYHRPHASDDAHGYGMPSRFLTAAVQNLFERTCGAGGAEAGNAEAGIARHVPERAPLRVSPDALFA